ncbi:hypothetical protein LTR96_011435 [Exophiala xenobiotica]|nr:hypothetical protein LTR41_011153 [Exophiala xenobiotica]KAK5217855.1 hypothetical protein LTR47_011807 [Exophiala xenobiotica]KAK5242618.1 hypothetical protein LTS06_011408 [Exophiala xenobiotica]KAK5263145.1 hypothetical protein LTR96_011435 [Exophiala xenobiotica]KAK5280457.1 hypothetical protein LTR40_006328 [Exophiala xenobiotica]
MIVIDTAALGAHTHVVVEAIQEEQQNTAQEQRDAILASRRWRQEHRAQDVLQWLSAADYGTQQSDFFQGQQDGTGQWLLESAAYKDWCGSDAAMLYGHGMPGAGKTMMTSIVVNHLSTEFGSDPGTGIAYLYCNFRRQEEQSAVNMLASILKQLALGRPQMAAGVERLYETHHAKQTRPSLKEVEAELHVVASAYSKAFILVDALDECRISDGGRQVFISALRNLQARVRSNIFVTSRINPQIARELGSGCIRVEIQASDDDVRRYLDGQMHRLPAFVQKSVAIQEEVKRGITDVVKGMFLLARLHLESLTTAKSVKALRTRLQSLPIGSDAYNRAYVEAMERIQSQNADARELAIQALSWISCAQRPLTTQELRHALAVEAATSDLDEDNLSDLDDILSVCAGLVVVDEESQIIRLIHYTLLQCQVG